MYERMQVCFAFALILAFSSGCSRTREGQAGPTTSSVGIHESEQTAVNEPSSSPLALLRRYFSFEQAQQYEKIYGLLSKKRKHYLERFHVRNEKQYGELRESSEARWSDFSIEKNAAGERASVVYFGHATVEESGESKKTAFKAVLIQEEREWRIDDWQY